jgi:signal transduction histidine kinase
MASTSIAFLRFRFRTTDIDSTTSFVASTDDPRARVAAASPQRLDPRTNPYRLVVQVNPSRVGELMYGSRRGLAWTMLALLVITISLAVATLFIARRVVSHMQEREAFATAVAHDLRTPLTQILLYAETLTLDRPAVRTKEEAARVIVRETRRLVHLVENALQFVRLGRARPSLAVAPLDLGAAISESIDALRPLLERADVHVTLEVDDAVIAAADPTALAQVLTNLIDNAMRFGPSGQTITITARRQGDRAIVTVDDEGPGIPERMREEVFKPFVRAGKSPGSGIGLSVSRQLAESMGGMLTASEAPGRGSRLTLALPLATHASTAARVLAAETAE